MFVKRFRKLFTRITTPTWRIIYCLLIQSICQQKCFEDSWFNQTHFHVQRLALQRGVLCFLPILSQGRAPSDFLGYSLLTFSIVAHSLGFVKRFSRKNSWIFSFIPCVPLRRDLNVIGERSIATSNRSPTPTCGSGVSPLDIIYYSTFNGACQEGKCESVTELSHPPARPPWAVTRCSLLTLSIITDCPQIAIDKITKLREKIFFTFVQLFSWQNWRGVV